MSKENEKVFLRDYSKKDKKWDSHKTSSTIIDYYYSSSGFDYHRKYGERINKCADLLRFKFIDDEQTGESELKLREASFCRVRLCPVCQWRRSMLWRAKLFEALPKLLDEHKNLEFLFLTLTVQNCQLGDLSSTLLMMNNAFAKLRKRKEFKSAVLGFIRATEVTKNKKDGTAHPHFHCILAVDKNYFKNKTNYIAHEKWCEIWQSCLKADYIPVVDIRKIRKKGNEIESRAVVETLKYTTKVEDLIDDKAWFLELSDQLFKKRFLATGGVFKDILKDEVSERAMLLLSEDDKLEQELEELENSLFFSYERGLKRYKKV